LNKEVIKDNFHLIILSLPFDPLGCLFNPLQDRGNALLIPFIRGSLNKNVS